MKGRTADEAEDAEIEQQLLDEMREMELQAMMQERRQSRSSLWISELHDIQEVEEEDFPDTNRDDAKNGEKEVEGPTEE